MDLPLKTTRSFNWLRQWYSRCDSIGNIILWAALVVILLLVQFKVLAIIYKAYLGLPISYSIYPANLIRQDWCALRSLIKQCHLLVLWKCVFSVIASAFWDEVPPQIQTTPILLVFWKSWECGSLPMPLTRIVEASFKLSGNIFFIADQFCHLLFLYLLSCNFLGVFTLWSTQTHWEISGMQTKDELNNYLNKHTNKQ